LVAFGVLLCAARADSPRNEISLDAGWRTIAHDTDPKKYDGFEQPGFDDSAWQRVDVPHNWDDYGGAHRVVHGNRHGYAWYRRSFAVPEEERGRRVFLFFEGVGSYATVWVNGRLAGSHAGGRTTFTLDVTELVKPGAENLVAVRADHPAGITDLPWVCGGCSSAQGFSEGSQPMGIFRPVSLITTNDVRVVPFGVHVWNDADTTAKTAKVSFRTEVANYGAARALVVWFRILDHEAREVAAASKGQKFPGGESLIESAIALSDVALWSLESPTLYTLETTICDGGRVLDLVRTPFGIRTIQWPAPDAPLPAPFRLNGEPVFINGTCEYEHLLGASHAFSDELIAARVAQMRAAGFNSFRDAHQPHNLRYQEYWDREGLLWWTQMAAQIWYDTPEFRANFKTLLREWVRERRNSPSLVLWGLANESKLPADFAAECVAIIRELDPTTSSQRLVTTCNAGTGTDWNVPQNWTGTYGGDPATYADDLRRQRLIGEYGAWRSLGLHSEGGYLADGVRSEDRADAIFATKIRLAESIRDEVSGHYHWLFATHDNPGRAIGTKGQQGTDGWAELDRIGPANNKGLLTLWGEPTDAFYLYRASYVPAQTRSRSSGGNVAGQPRDELWALSPLKRPSDDGGYVGDPMVYIVSHTWPDRWTEPGRKSGLLVYSNCEEVELFNGVEGRQSLGVRKQGGPGVPFRWDDVEIRTHVLYAEGRVGGKVVARDAIALKNLPEAPGWRALLGNVENVTAPAPGQNYLYRVNCGGPDYADRNGQRWLADQDLVPGQSWGSRSWAMDYPDVPPRFGSQRESSELIKGTYDQVLFQTYRYGREKLSYVFAVPDGEYRLELYFTEPWYGAGGGDCTGWRLFDVALNGDTVLRDVDLWKEGGFAHAIKKVVTAEAKDGQLIVSFPRVASYQAVISAIAISTADISARVPAVGAVLSAKALATADALNRPSASLAQPNQGGWGQEPSPRLRLPGPSLPGETVYPFAAAKADGPTLVWVIQLGLGGGHDFAIRYVNPGPEPLTAELKVTAADGTVMGRGQLELALTAGATATLADIGMNAGDYTVTLTLPAKGSLKIESLIVK
jgi:beta-galactosidase